MTDPDHKPERVYAVADRVPDTAEHLTAGKRYEVTREHSGGFGFLDDHGEDCFAFWCGSFALDGGNWTRVTEPHPQAPAAEIGGEELARLIETRLLGVAPDSQDLVLEDHDWRLIIAALQHHTKEAPDVG